MRERGSVLAVIPVSLGCGAIVATLSYLDTGSSAASISFGVLGMAVVALLWLRRDATQPAGDSMHMKLAIAPLVILLAGGLVVAVLTRSVGIGVVVAATTLFWSGLFFLSRMR